MSHEAVFWVTCVALAVTCLSAIGAKALTEFSRRELEEICRRRKSPDRLGQILRRHELVSLGAETLQVIATALLICAVVFWIWRESDHRGQPPSLKLLAICAAIGAPVLLAVEIWIPWAVVRLWATPFVYYTWPVWRVVTLLLTPAVLAARFVSIVLHRLAGRTPEVPDEESFEDEIRTIVTEGHREGLLDEDAREMIEGVIELSDATVSQIMTPRTDMVSIPLSLSWQEVVRFVVTAGHTRTPVHDKNLDDIVGVLHAKDLLPELAKEPDESLRSWTSLLREPCFVPETKPVDVLLQELQRAHNHMAIVLDEYGGVAGLVTMEDVLEEIVGEIVDEYDKEQVDGIRDLGNGVAEVLAKVHIDEINERLGLDLPEEEDYDTIGGFVFSELGHIPVVDEELVRRNIRITVLEATRRRVERVRIEVIPSTGSGKR